MRKHFVLDTNILLSYPDAMIKGFDDNEVIITSTTLQELDFKKTEGGDVGYNARESIRILDSYREKGDLVKGVELPDGGVLRVEPDGISEDNLPKGGAFKLSNPDNQIISTCKYLQKREKLDADREGRDVEPVILVTNDVSMRISATACLVDVQAYKNSQVIDSGYKGYTDLIVPKSLIDDIYKNKTVPYTDDELYVNEFITLHSDSDNASALTIYRGGKLEHIPEQREGWVKPKNALQTYALWALSRPCEDIPLVIILGPAGTGKTFLSLATGIGATIDKGYSDTAYDKMILARPLGLGYQEGFLPGDLDEKLKPLHACFTDALTAYFKADKRDMEDEYITNHIDDLYDRGVLEACALSFIRGRSLMNSFVVCDETQNATRLLMRDCITRIGSGSKLVVMGDPDQIDVPYLDRRTNGLSYAAEAFKDSDKACIIKMTEEQAVRSPLASEALKRMKF